MGGVRVVALKEQEEEEQFPAPWLLQNISFSAATSAIAWFRSISINAKGTRSFFLTEKGVTFDKRRRKARTLEARTAEIGGENGSGGRLSIVEETEKRRAKKSERRRQL
ncbi:hypothetical protein SAY87_001895 [Trapa incisa]|uniref:Uncharacterized protein n=1 Tax=Trapa incisa TaxID=236973 RepID=A0AAN7JU27_9MYRT|nr:hypothetical protein SAY87_001895 [Trapa incisa]